MAGSPGSEIRRSGFVITQVIAWVPLAIIGCAAFAALGIWASVTDESYRRQRIAKAMQPVPVPSRPTVEGGVNGQVAVPAGGREKVSSFSG